MDIRAPTLEDDKKSWGMVVSAGDTSLWERDSYLRARGFWPRRQSELCTKMGAMVVAALAVDESGV